MIKLKLNSDGTVYSLIYKQELMYMKLYFSIYFDYYSAYVNCKKHLKSCCINGYNRNTKFAKILERYSENENTIKVDFQTGKIYCKQILLYENLSSYVDKEKLENVLTEWEDYSIKVIPETRKELLYIKTIICGI